MGRPKQFKTEEERKAHEKEYQKQYHAKLKALKKRYCSAKTLDNSIERILTCDKYIIQMLKAIGKHKVNVLLEKL